MMYVQYIFDDGHVSDVVGLRLSHSTLREVDNVVSTSLFGVIAIEILKVEII